MGDIGPGRDRRDAGREWLLDEQAALRRVATLVARGASEVDLVGAVTSEVAGLFRAQSATTMRWDGDALEVIGDWSETEGGMSQRGRRYSYGRDTLPGRVVEASAPARVDAPSEDGAGSSIGAPVIVDGDVWGVITASREAPFARGAEERLADFAALVAQAVANAQARRQLAALAEEQAALRRIATLVAAGKPHQEVVNAVTAEAARSLGASAVALVRWEGVHDEVRVVGSSGDDTLPDLRPGSLYHPQPGGPTLGVLETGFATRGTEQSTEVGECAAVAVPLIVEGRLVGASTALRAPDEPFAADAADRLRGFGDLAAQSAANARARSEMRASRERLVRAGDEVRGRFERNLHDGAQQRILAVAMTLRAAVAKLDDEPELARTLLRHAADDLSGAAEELREFARGIHPSVVSERGLVAALEALAQKTPLPIAIVSDVDERLPKPVEFAAYYVVAESLANVSRHADASSVEIRVACDGDVARVEIVDDGVGGANVERGSGLRGLTDRVEAIGGRLHVVSPPNAGTRVWAEFPLTDAVDAYVV